MTETHLDRAAHTDRTARIQPLHACSALALDSTTPKSAEAVQKAPFRALFALLLALLLAGFGGALAGCASDVPAQTGTSQEEISGVSAGAQESTETFDVARIPSYTGNPYTVVNDNVPSFTEADAQGPSEHYADLDELGRCGTTQAIVGIDTMPTEKRGEIGMVKPSGWHTVRYDDLIDDRNLYNRCHLIGYQLTGENANEKNLITGTRYLNTEGMLPFEDEVAAYVKSTGNHVLYRVTPVFAGSELVARGVHMEAQSVEDGGAGVSFNVFCYNVQPGIGINYATGDSWREEAAIDGDAVALAASGEEGTTSESTAAEGTYILNTKSMKFHLPTCDGALSMSSRNKLEFTGTRQEAIEAGYSPCMSCNP